MNHATFTVNIEDQRAEKAVSFSGCIGSKYDVNYSGVMIDNGEKPLPKKAQKLYEELKKSLQEIKRWERGEVSLREAKDLLNEL